MVIIWAELFFLKFRFFSWEIFGQLNLGICNVLPKVRREIQSYVNKARVKWKRLTSCLYIIYTCTCIGMTLVEIPVSNILNSLMNKIVRHRSFCIQNEIFSTIHWKQKHGIGFVALTVANNSELCNLHVTRLLTFKFWPSIINTQVNHSRHSSYELKSWPFTFKFTFNFIAYLKIYPFLFTFSAKNIIILSIN